VVCGPFGSGTSAVAGLLDRLGAIGFGPYFRTNDERTPNSFELLPFRETVQALVSEETLSLGNGARDRAPAVFEQLRARIENQELGHYDSRRDNPIFLKYPPAALLIPELGEAFAAKFIYVLRPIEEIEETRRRRNWPSRFGAPAANAIYARMFDALVKSTYPTLVLRYSELLGDPLKAARAVASFAAIPAGSKRLHDAAAFIRQAGPRTLVESQPSYRLRAG